MVGGNRWNDEQRYRGNDKPVRARLCDDVRAQKSMEPAPSIEVFPAIQKSEQVNPIGTGTALCAGCFPALFSFGDAMMKDFANAAFVPEMVSAMTEALDASIAALPHPVSSTQVNLLAESILRTAREGERDPIVLQRMALLELQIRPREN
jgi:hypothetical protein